MDTQKITDVKIKEALVDFISLQFYVDKEDIEIDKSLVDTGIIDSIGLIEIAAYIEREYSIKVEESQMTKENFGSVEKIVKFIQKHIKPE